MWIAELSDGSIVVEGEGEWVERPGERLPWVRLCRYATASGLRVVSLGLPNFRMPDAPQYSIVYHLVVDDALGGQEITEYINLGSHYGNFSIHYIQNLADPSDSRIESSYEPTLSDALSPA